MLRDWAKDKVQRSCRGIEQVPEASKQKIKPLLLVELVQSQDN